MLNLRLFGNNDGYLDGNGDYMTPFMRVLAGVMIVITLCGAFFAGLFPILSSNDPWWHLKTGKVLWEHFLEHGFQFPEYDVFTYTGAQTPWVNHEWLSHLIFYGAYQLGGLQGAIIMKSLVITLTFALLILYMYRNGVGWKMACLGSIIALLASQQSLFLRPPIFTNLFIVIFLHIILSFQLGENFRWAFIGAVAAEIVWVNLHGGAVIGIILIFFWWLSEVWCCLVTWLHENPTAPSFRRLRSSSLVLVAVILASFVNPFTYHIHLLPFKVTGDWWLLRHVGELQAPNMQINNAFEMIILGLFMLPMMRAGSIWVYEGLAVVFFGHQALNYHRHIPLFALVAVPPLIAAISEERRAFFPMDTGRGASIRGFWGTLFSLVRWGMRYHVDVIIIFVLFAYTFGLRPGKIWHRNMQAFPLLLENGYDKEAYPEDPVNFLLYHKISGPMFNHDNFAGYLIWRLSPEHMKLFTDSRYDLWGSRFAKEELGVFQVWRVPLGAYDTKGRWYPFQRELTRQDTFHQIRSIGSEEDFPEFFDWYHSEKPYWQYLLDKYEVNFIISYEGEYIDRYLRDEFRGWYLIYDDTITYRKSGGYVIYLRDKSENAELIRKLAIRHKDRLTEESET
ncbi:MAG: hypothetical protein C4527_22295 [Candidatus Omnitrophota bacterium]|nr:MAG: hypothetical protein C4527_22295 [Candidatus Omnitrophota bacterium]